MARVRGMHGERLESAIGRVEAVVVRVLRGIARTVASLVGGSPSPSALSNDDFQAIRRDWGEAVTVEIVPAVAEVYRESAEVLAKEFANAGRPVDVVSLEAPSAADFLEAATNRLVAVSDTLWDVARKELADGVRAGEGIEELAARLQVAGGFGEARARMIARTEVVAASNSASLAQALRLGDPSINKEWLATTEASGLVCDERTRDAHCDAHEQVQPLGEPFEVGETWLMYPGQPVGPADQVINCRCGIGYVMEDGVGEPLTAAAPEEFHLPGKHDQREHGKDGIGIPEAIGGQATDGSPAASTSVGRDRTSVGETVKKFGSRSVTLAAHDDGQLSLADDSGNKVRLSRDEVTKLRTNAIYSDEMEVGDEFTVSHTEDRDGAPYTTLRMLVRKTTVVPEDDSEDGDETYLRDTVAVHLAPNDDPDFDELRNTPPVEMTAEELTGLAGALVDLATAGRVDTGYGQVDMFSDGRSFVLRPVDGPELRLNRRGLRNFDKALDGVIDDFDDANGTRPGGALRTDETAERVVDTNVGQVTVSLTGGFGVGDLTIRIPDRDVEIVVAPAQQSAFFDQFGLLSDGLIASASRRRRGAMPADFPLELVTAAAEVHTGGMVALRPSADEAERLAVEGGEPAEQLHSTLAYLGDAADIPPEVQQQIIARLTALVEDAIRPDYDLPMIAEGFAIDVFNPPGAAREDGKDRETCIVLGLSGGDLGAVHALVTDTVAEVFKDAGLSLPEQHAPWIPHVTLTYTDDVGRVEELMGRAGPVTFDAIRVAFGGANTDIPLRPRSARAVEEENPSGDLAAAPGGEESTDLGNEVEPSEGWDGYFAARIAEFVGSDAKLREYWIRGKGAAKIRWPQPGAFKRCVRQLGKYVRDPEGLCAEYYREANGRWPGEKKDNASAADTDGGSAALDTDSSATDLATTEVGGEPSAPDPMAALPGEHFHTRVMEGVSTGMRQFAPGAITWRTPPFAYHWQWKSSAHNGLPETIQVGLITRAEREGDNVHFWGRLDLRSPEGLDYARRLVEGFARWSSVGGDESIKDKYIDVEYVLADEPNPGTPVEDPEIDLMTFNQYRVAEISGVSVPALADATVEPTQELIDTLIAMGVIDPAGVADEPPAVEEIQEDEVADFAAVQAQDTPATEETPDAGGAPSDLDSHPPVVVVAAGHTITLPEAPPAAWFDEPADDELPPYGSVRVDANGRLIGLLAPAQVNHRSFPDKQVKVPMGNVDYSGWMNKTWQVDDGRSINVGVITMDCGHASTSPGDWSYSNRREHYDNTCSIAAHARVYEKPGIGVALAGAVAPWLDAEGFGKLLSSDLSGDWPPHPDRQGWRDFIAALAVPVGGFANRARLRVAEGALVAAAVPVQFEDDMEEPMEMDEAAFVEGDTVRVVDDGIVGEVVAVHNGPAFAVRAVEGEPPRWHVAGELEPADATLPVEEEMLVEELVASAGPDLRPALERVAKSVGLDAVTRMEVLRNRVHSAT